MGERKFFLDWLRVLAFGSLVLFHVGMLYVTWDYNLKSPRLYPALEWFMEAMSPWRMPLLFVISGVACRFLIAKLGAGGFTANRLGRLGIVILTATLLVNSEQVWIQLIAQGSTMQGYFAFWFSSYLTGDATLVHALGRPMPTWDHLWFVVYLLPYSLLLAAGSAVGASRTQRSAPLWLLVVIPAIWMAMTNVTMATVAPFTHAFVNDWGAHLKWLGLFLVGALVGKREEFWSLAREHRAVLALTSLVLLTVYLGLRAAWLPDREHLAWTACLRIAEGVYGWTAVLALSGFAMQFLNKTSSALRYLNEAVLPVYVLHQPVLLTTAYLLFPLQLPLVVEVLALVCATGLGSVLLYHLLIRPWRSMRFLFGVTPKAEHARNARHVRLTNLGPHR